jgi:hypothetical protein
MSDRAPLSDQEDLERQLQKVRASAAIVTTITQREPHLPRQGRCGRDRTGRPGTDHPHVARRFGARAHGLLCGRGALRGCAPPDRRAILHELSRLCRTPARLPRRVLCFWVLVVLHGRRVPANLPVGRDLTIRRKIENGRYYCAFLPFETNQGTEAAVYEAVYAYPNRPAPFDVSAGINAGYGPRKRSPAASRRR